MRLGFENGTGGVFGMGPGALVPLFPIPLLHLAYNPVAYAPALLAFALLSATVPNAVTEGDR